MHKLIKKETTEYIVPKDDDETKKLLNREEKKPTEDDTDVMDDYDSGLDEFIDSMDGFKTKPKKTNEIRALGD